LSMLDAGRVHDERQAAAATRARPGGDCARQSSRAPGRSCCGDDGSTPTRHPATGPQPRRRGRRRGERAGWPTTVSAICTVTETEKHPGASDEVYVSNIVYDALNRATSIKRVDRLQPTHQPETQLKYDSRHNVVEVIDPIGRVMRTTYDLLSRPTLQIEDALGLAIDTSYNYDDDGLLAALTDADGQQTSWVHDPLGRVARVDYELGLFEAFTYDAADNVLTHRAQDGVISTHAYFSDNQLKDRTAGALKEEFDWNALGLPSTATVNKGGVTSSTLGLGYDGFGRVNRETAHGYDLLVGYDAGHNVTSLLYPDGLSVVKTYDELDRVQTVSDSSSTLSTYTWIGRSRLKNRTAGVVESYTWDGLRRLTRINAGAVQDLSYGYDDLDRRTWIQRTHQSGVGDVYDYDGGSRLSDVWYGATNPPSGTSGYAQHFEIDQTKADDRTSTSVNGTSTSYNASDPLHRYTQIGSVAREYDAKGNLIDDGAQLYEYDAWNRLTRVVDKATQAERTRFELDAFGRRASRIQGSVTQRYFYLGARLKSERSVDEGPLGGFSAQSQNSTNVPGVNPWRDYVYGAGLDQAVAFYSGGVQYDGYHDALGSLGALVRRSTGALSERYSYDAFGTPSVTNGAGTPLTNTWGRPTSVLGNELWFAGGRWDGESGNYHLRARQYEPAAGRFVSRDPLGYVDGPNPYVYGFSDPVNWTDPFGLQAQCAQSGPRAPQRVRTPKEEEAHRHALQWANANHEAARLADAAAGDYDWAVSYATGVRNTALVVEAVLGGAYVAPYVAPYVLPTIGRVTATTVRAWTAGGVLVAKVLERSGPATDRAQQALQRAQIDAYLRYQGMLDRIAGSGGRIAESSSGMASRICPTVSSAPSAGRVPNLLSATSNYLFGRGGWGLFNGRLTGDWIRLGYSWQGSARAGREVFRLVIGSKRLPFHWHLTLWDL